MNDSDQESIIEVARDLVAASRRLRAKFGTDKQGKLRDWSEWKDLDAACDAVESMVAKREVKATPPITRRCPFCKAPTNMIRIEPRTDNKRYCMCAFCLAIGPANSLPDDETAIVVAVWEWNFRSSGKEWKSDKACNDEYNKRSAFIAKWARACKD